jgi:hypothetical protein
MLGPTTENTGPSLSRDQLVPKCWQFGPDHTQQGKKSSELNATQAGKRGNSIKKKKVRTQKLAKPAAASPSLPELNAC